MPQNDTYIHRKKLDFLEKVDKISLKVFKAD